MFSRIKKWLSSGSQSKEVKPAEAFPILFESEADRAYALTLLGVGLVMCAGIEPAEEELTFRFHTREQMVIVLQSLAAALYLGGTGKVDGRMSDLRDIANLRDGSSEADGFDDSVKRTQKRVAIALQRQTAMIAEKVHGKNWRA